APAITNGTNLTQTWRLVVKNLANPSGIAAPVITVLVLADSDNDGLPDEWELANHLNPTNALDAASDTDGDGMKNWEEYVAGTDPRDPLSRLSIEPFTVSNPAQIS